MWSVSSRYFASIAMFERAYRSGIGLLVIQQVKLFQNGLLGAINCCLRDERLDEYLHRTIWEIENNIEKVV